MEPAPAPAPAEEAFIASLTGAASEADMAAALLFSLFRSAIEGGCSSASGSSSSSSSISPAPASSGQAGSSRAVACISDTLDGGQKEAVLSAWDHLGRASCALGRVLRGNIPNQDVNELNRLCLDEIHRLRMLLLKESETNASLTRLLAEQGGAGAGRGAGEAAGRAVDDMSCTIALLKRRRQAQSEDGSEGSALPKAKAPKAAPATAPATAPAAVHEDAWHRAAKAKTAQVKETEVRKAQGDRRHTVKESDGRRTVKEDDGRRMKAQSEKAKADKADGEAEERSAAAVSGGDSAPATSSRSPTGGSRPISAHKQSYINALVGRYISKPFPSDRRGGPHFVGLVVSYRKPFYKVVYEDGDMEEIGAREVNHWTLNNKAWGDLSEETKMSCQRFARVLTVASPAAVPPGKGSVRV
jgi:hypothetical protein